MFICYIFKKRFAFQRFSKNRPFFSFQRFSKSASCPPLAPVPGDSIACHQSAVAALAQYFSFYFISSAEIPRALISE